MAIQAYQGHFREDGRFVADGSIIDFPTKRLAIVNILDEPIETITKIDSAEVQKKLDIIHSLSGILPPDTDFEAAKAERIAKRALL